MQACLALQCLDGCKKICCCCCHERQKINNVVRRGCCYDRMGCLEYNRNPLRG